MKTEPIDLAALAATIERSEALATELRRSPPCDNRSGGVSCVHRESERKLDAAERRRHNTTDRTRRAFAEIDPMRLCNACAAWWHASMATNVLRDLQRVELYCAAESDRDAAERAGAR